MKTRSQMKGRTTYNKMLYSEYSVWYDAFKAEAQDDYEVVGAEDANTRWSRHVVKKLKKRTGETEENLYAVVAAWLLLKEED